MTKWGHSYWQSESEPILPSSCPDWAFPRRLLKAAFNWRREWKGSLQMPHPWALTSMFLYTILASSIGISFPIYHLLSSMGLEVLKMSETKRLLSMTCSSFRPWIRLVCLRRHYWKELERAASETEGIKPGHGMALLHRGAVHSTGCDVQNWIKELHFIHYVCVATAFLIRRQNHFM